MVDIDPDLPDVDDMTASNYLDDRPDNVARAMNDLLKRIRSSRQKMAEEELEHFVDAPMWQTLETEVQYSTTADGVLMEDSSQLLEKDDHDIDSAYASDESQQNSDDEEESEHRRPTIASRQRPTEPAPVKRWHFPDAADPEARLMGDVKLARDLTEALHKLREIDEASKVKEDRSALSTLTKLRTSMLFACSLGTELPLRRLLAMSFRPKVSNDHIRVTWKCVSFSGRSLLVDYPRG